MHLNTTEKLLIFFILFLNCIPINKAQALKRSNIQNKTNIEWLNKIFQEWNKSNLLKESFKNQKFKFQKHLLSDLELEINYS